MIVSVGDSVLWGQGLREAEKFDRLLADARSEELLRLAHSGAILGSEDEPPASTSDVHPEIPVSCPSLWQQVRGCRRWQEAEVVLLNGGMNDVDLRRILHPWTSPAELAPEIDRVCRGQMQALLLHIADRLTRPEARIVVLGYYPILSRQSRYPGRRHAHTLLQTHGVHAPRLIPEPVVSTETMMSRVESNCLAFWRDADAAFAKAVDAANTQLGGNRCLFVPLPLTEENALWAPASLLFELTPELEAEDPVRAGRNAACALTYPRVLHPFKRIQCDRASAGHPNVAGAARIAAALVEKLTKATAATL